MDKESCTPDSERRDKSALLDAARTLDPSSLFAYWPRGDSGTSAATNALFGTYNSGNPLTSGRNSYSGSSNSSNVPNSASAAAAYGNTLSVAASQAASLGINPASAAWWTVASHLAAQDYLARLHGMSFSGLPGAEALYPNFLLSGSNPGVPLPGKSLTKSNSISSTHSGSKGQTSSNSLSTEKDREKENWTSSDKDREKSKERNRIKERDRLERDWDKERDGLLNKNATVTSSGSKTDHLASIAALANSGTSLSPFPPQAHSSSDSVGMLGGVRLPPDTEIIKYTSSIGGPKIPGTTSRGRKKTISLDPPSVSVMPTHSSTGIPIDLGQPFRSQAPSDSGDSSNQVEVIKLPAHSSSNGVVSSSKESSDDILPLNLCTKSRIKEDFNSDKDRVSRRKPVPKQRRSLMSEFNPISSLSAMSQLFTSEMNMPTTADEDTDNSLKDGRSRNLGRGVSKPKKNTVASLLAQSRALGLKGSLPGEFASQLAALKTSLPSDICSQLALLQNLQSPMEDFDGADKRSLTPESAAAFDEKNRVKTSEDGSLTTDSASTGGSDSESENGTKVLKVKKEKKDNLLENVKVGDIASSVNVKMKDELPYKESKSPQPASIDEQFLYSQELNKQKELLYAVELEKERRRQHMILVRALENRKKIEERERKRIELRAEKIAKHEKRLEQRRIELELLKELRRPIEDMELDDLKPMPEFDRIPGLKLAGQAFADTLMVFEFLHNFGETLGFDMESLPTLNSLQGALLNDEENEEELLSIMTHLLVCAIEDPGIPNPARHITLLGQSLKQADITHTNISEILRIYLYANATGEVKALTGLNFEKDREKKISEHHNLYGEEAQNFGKNAAFFESLYENPTYKLSEELKEKPFLALNPTTKSAILAFICNELLQNKAVLRQIEGSLETVILSRRERWVLDQSIRKLRCLHDRQLKYSINVNTNVNAQANAHGSFKEKNTEGVDSDVESAEDSDHESEITQPEEDDQQQNLNTEEIGKQLEKLLKQQESHLMNLKTSNQQIRAMCLGQDRYWRRYWCLPKCGSIFIEGMESSQPDEYIEAEAEKMDVTSQEEKVDEVSVNANKENKESSELANDGNDEPVKKPNISQSGKRKCSKRKEGTWSSIQAKKNKLNETANSDGEASDNENKTKISEVSQEVFQERNLSESDTHKNIKAEPEDNGEAPPVIERFDENTIKQENICDKKVGDLLPNTESDGEETKIKIKVDVKRMGEQNDENDVETGVNDVNIKKESECNLIEENDKKASSLVKDTITLKPYDMLMRDPVQEYIDKFKGIDQKDTENLKEMRLMKEYLLDMTKQIETEADLRELAEKCKFEDDPLLKAMKRELSNRIFGSPIISAKREGLDDLQAFRNAASPCLPCEDKFPSCQTMNNFNSPKESESDCQWFSLLPKESCDPQSLLHGKHENEKLLSLLNLRSKIGLPPSPGPIPLCDSPAPLILSHEEAAMLERLKTSGPRAPPVRKTIPKHLRRGWWKLTCEEDIFQFLECLHARGVREKELKRLLTRYLEENMDAGGKLMNSKGNEEYTELDDSIDYNGRVKFLDDGAPVQDEPHSWDQSVFERVESLMLEQVENLEDKVASASMQVKGWRLPNRLNSSDDSGDGPSKKSKLEPIEIAKQRLISLEAAIERRYLKPPLGFSTTEGGIGIQVDQDESIPKGLGIWREAVSKSHTAAQVSMALYMLESCIAWDKSIMKANCQFCQSGDNEDKLLLCDGCDRGYHMYCFKPKMESIPDGDWYCHECKNKSSGEKNCIVCGKRPTKNFVICEHCPRIYHADCLNPPLLKIPRAKWNCVSCAIKFPKKKCGRKVGWRKNKEKDLKNKDEKDHKDPSSGTDEKANDNCEGKTDEKSEGETDGEDMPLSASVASKEKECAPLSPIPSTTCSNSSVNDKPPPLSPQQPTGTSARKERQSKKLCRELNACKSLVEEMELQDEAWPFLLPVNTKQFPTYKKIIKCPMDISTIKKRLTEGLYKTKEEFVYDVRQIFNNCETFNEDDSPVGKAGHAMRSFFETRWGEITNQKPTP